MRPIQFLLLPFALIICTFVVAQTPCDVLQAEVFVHPVLTELAVVKITSPEAINVNYPSFNLLMDGELVAEGETFFFALPQGDSFHLLEPTVQLVEGMNYNFTVELYSGFGSTFECSMDLTETPYDISECFTGDLTVSPVGGASQELEIIVEDENGIVLLEENLELSSQNPVAIYSLCLERACYSVSVEAVGSSFTTDYLVGFASGLTWFSGLAESGNPMAVFELDFWEGCSFVGIREANKLTNLPLYPEIALSGTQVAPMKPQVGSVSTVVYSMGGRLVAEHHTPEWQVPQTPGLYLVHYEQAGIRGTQKLLVVR